MSSPAAQPDVAYPATAGLGAPSPASTGKIGSPRYDEPRGALAVAIREAQASKDPALARRQAEARRQYMKTHSPYSFQRDSSDKFTTKYDASSRAELAVSQYVYKRRADQLSPEASSRRRDTMHARLDGAHASLTERERYLDERSVYLDALQSQLEATAEVLQIHMSAGSIAGGTAASGRDDSEQYNEIDALRALVVQYRAERDQARADCKHAERRLRALEAERAAMGRVLENIRPGLLSDVDSGPDREYTKRQLAPDAVPMLEDAPAAGQAAGPSAGRGGAMASSSDKQHPRRGGGGGGGGGPTADPPASSSPSPGSNPSHRLHSSRMARSIGSRTSASSPLALAQGMRVRGSSQTASVLSGMAGTGTGTGTGTPGRGTGAGAKGPEDGGARGPSLPVQSPSQMLAASRAGQPSTRSSTTPSQAGVPRRRVVRVSLRVGPGNRLKSVGRLHRLLEKRLHRQVVGLRWGDVSLDDRGVALAATGLPLDKEVELAVVVLRAGPGASSGKVAKEVIGEESPTAAGYAPSYARVADAPKKVAAGMQSDEEDDGINQRKYEDDEAHQAGRDGDARDATSRTSEAGSDLGNKPKNGGASDHDTLSAASSGHTSDNPAQEKATNAPAGPGPAVAKAGTAMKPSQVLLTGASPPAAYTGTSLQVGAASPAEPAAAPGTAGASMARSPDNRRPLSAIATHGHSASSSSMSGTPYLPTAGPGGAAMPPSPSSHTPVSLPPPRLLVAFPSDHDIVRGLVREREGSSEATGVLYRHAAEAGHIRSPSEAEVAQVSQLIEGEESGGSAGDLAWSPIGLVIGEKRPVWMQEPTPVSDEVKQRVAQEAGERRVGLGHIFGRMRKLARPRPLVDHVHSAVRYWGLPTKGPKAESTRNSTAVLLLMELQAVPEQQGASQATPPVEHTGEVGPGADDGNGSATSPASASAPLLTPSALLAASPPPSTRGYEQPEGGQSGTMTPSSGGAGGAGEQGGSGSGSGAASSDEASKAYPVAGEPAVVLEEIVDPGEGRGGEQEVGGEAGAGQGIQLRSSRASPQRQGRLDVTPEAWGLKGGTGAQ